VSWDKVATNTYTYVIEPYYAGVFLVKGSFDPTAPLQVVQTSQIFSRGLFGDFQVASATIYYAKELLVVGLAMPGKSAGWLATVHLSNISIHNFTALPANFSDPRALAIDETTGNLYIGFNGGPGIIRFNLNTYEQTGYQPLPFYLHRVWAGLAAPEHVYFVTNEQHSKIFRVYKDDFCTAHCPEFGYCHRGKCVCPEETDMQFGKCQWKGITKEKREHAGEVALGILFAFAFVGAASGWFMWFKTRRHAYQAVN